MIFGGYIEPVRWSHQKTCPLVIKYCTWKSLIFRWCLYIYIYTQSYIHDLCIIYIYMWYIYIFIFIYIYIYIFIWYIYIWYIYMIYIYMIYIYICMYVCMYLYIYIINPHIYIYNICMMFPLEPLFIQEMSHCHVEFTACQVVLRHQHVSKVSVSLVVVAIHSIHRQNMVIPP